MKGIFYKNIFFKIIFLFLKVIQMKCNEEEKKERKIKIVENKENEDYHPDMMKILIDLKIEIQNIYKDIAKYDTLIYLLAPTCCLLFLIIIGFVIYEIIKYCKKEDLNETSKISNYSYSDDNNQNNYYEIKYFLNEEPNQKKENQNSNHTSKLAEKLNSKKLLISNKYRVNDIIVEESNESVGHSVEEANSDKSDDKDEKVLTNIGEEEQGKDKKFVPNPFLK